MQEAARRTFWHGKSSGYWGLTFTAEEAGSTISMTKGANAPTLNLVTSVDRGKTWQTFTPGETTITLAEVGDSVWFAAGASGNTHTASSSANANIFSMTGRISASGSIMSLLNASTPTYTCGHSYTFTSLFSGCTSLVSAPELPAMSLNYYSYCAMFQDCTLLAFAPELPATTLTFSCYTRMFQGCTSLVSAPEFPATRVSDYCCSYMFNGCTSLVSAPSELLATTLADSCYIGMFQNCTSLTAAPELPATTLSNNCYYYMFSGCTSLVSAPVELPATTLANYCCYYMFQGCTSLTTAPELPATTSANHCYDAMFLNCTSLVSAPAELPATTLSLYCYSQMFQGCTSLVSAPELPATTLANYCYSQMFRGCSSLVSAPIELPATTLAERCYNSMFNGCTLLTSAPELPAMTLAIGCYAYMFSGCTSLTNVNVGFTSWEVSNSTAGWLSSVKSTGTFKCPILLGTNETITRGSSYCPTNWNVVMREYAVEFIAEEAGCVINMTSDNDGITPIPTLSIEYSVDGNSWSDFDTSSAHSTPVTLANVGDAVFFRAKNPNTTFCSNNDGAWNWFTTSKTCKVCGNVMSLLNGQNRSLTTISAPFALAYLFYGCKITDASLLELPATTLSENCYYCMFGDCTSLVSTPELPATTLAGYCYSQMFNGCTSLTSAPELPATTLASACYSSMFTDCTSLTNAPELPATTLANACYSAMFSRCTSLTTAPELPATTLQPNCYYYMFQGCTSLAKVNVGFTSWNGNSTTNWLSGVASTGEFICPEVLGTDSTITRGVSNCPTGWTVKNPNYLTFTAQTAGATIAMAKSGTAPEVSLKTSRDGGATWQPFVVGTTTITLPSIGDSVCFAAVKDNAGMGTNTSNYNYFVLSGSIAASGSIMSLLDGNGTGTDITQTYCFSYLFKDCIGLTSAPELLATTLTNYCYNYMFQGCTALTAPPELPATTLKTGCYRGLFDGCTSLSSAPVLPATTMVGNAYMYMFRNCTSLKSAPSLPATTLAVRCYCYMFYGCTALTTPPPILPATALTGSNTYQYMFYGCSNLEYAPVICLTTTPSSTQQMRYMFQNCTKLKKIEIHITSWPSTATIMGDWVDGVAADGLFVCPTALGTNATITRGTSNCPAGWQVNNYWGLCLRAEEAGCEVNMTKVGTPPAATLESSLDGVTWTTFDVDGGTTPITLANVGDKVYFRAGATGNSALSLDTSSYRTLQANKRIGASGNIMSLLNATDEQNKTISANFAFAYLFYGNLMSSAPDLPATTLSERCYYNMFYGCLGLVRAPKLPATTLAESCYNSMFFECHDLAIPPELPATTMTGNCYRSMFKNCTSLTYMPELPATTMASSCYMQMFYGCTSLTTVHDLPSTTLVAGCYRHMFRYCSSLERAPVMYFSSIPASSCVSYMFADCSSLNYIELRNLSSWLDDGSTPSWVDGVSASGLFVCPAALGTESTITRGTSNCPAGWTVANPVEYLQSTGTQWIDTGVVPNTNTKVQMKVMNDASTGYVIIGYFTSSDSQDWRLFNFSDSVYFDQYSQRINGSSFTAGNWRTLELGNYYVKDLISGATLVSGQPATFTGVSTITLNYARYYSSSSKNKWAYVKIYDGQNVARDFYPVRIDSEGCMLDKANLTGGTNNDGLYYNAGTGSFTLGPDV